MRKVKYVSPTRSHKKNLQIFYNFLYMYKMYSGGGNMLYYSVLYNPYYSSSFCKHTNNFRIGKIKDAKKRELHLSSSLYKSIFTLF